MIKRKCPNCGAIVESKFCTSCGQDLTGPDIVKICPKCGTETTSKFCTGCGTKLFEQQVTPKKDDETIASSSNGETHDKAAENRSAGSVSAAGIFDKAKSLGAQKVKDLEKSAEAKRALKEKEAELQREKQAREAALLREQQEREAEQRRIQEQRAAEEKARQLEEERKKAQEKAEHEKKKKQLEQKRIYEEAMAYMQTADQSDDHAVSAQFYRKAEELFSTIPEIDDAEKESILAARKAKEQEIILEEERIKAAQEAARIKAAEEAERTKAAQEDETAANAAKAAEEVEPAENLTSASEDVAPLIESPEVPSTQISSDTKAVTPEKPSGNSKSKIIIAIAAAAALAVGGIIFGMSHNSSDNTSASDQSTATDVEEDTSESAESSPAFDDANILSIKEVDFADDDSLDVPQKVATYEVTNKGKEEIWYFDADFQFLDKDGNQLCEDGRFHQGRLKPGKHTLMYSFSSDEVDVKEIASAKVKSYSYKIGATVYSIDLQTNSIETYEEDQEWYSNVDYKDADVLGFDITDKGVVDGDYETSVKVTNNGSNKIKEVSFDMEYYDKDDNPIDNDGRYSDSVLDSKKAVTIDSYCTKYMNNDPKQVSSYAITTYDYKLVDKDSRGYNKYTVNLVTKTAYGEYEDY